MEKGTYTFTSPAAGEQAEYERTEDRINRAFYQAQEENAFDLGEQISTRTREKDFLALIATGNPALLEEYLSKKFPAGKPVDIGVLSEDPLQQAKYIFVSGIALATRTAIDSGLPEKIARRISDAYIRYIDQMTDPEKIGRMFLHAAKTFCTYIGQHRLEKMDPELRSCCEFLSTHLHATVALEDLCHATHLSAYQITALFRRELNTTPIQYFLDLKMQYARQMLENSDMTVSQIAQLLAFPSHSNFSQRFKKQYNLTPQSYRAMTQTNRTKPRRQTGSNCY